MKEETYSEDYKKGWEDAKKDIITFQFKTNQFVSLNNLFKTIGFVPSDGVAYTILFEYRKIGSTEGINSVSVWDKTMDKFIKDLSDKA